MKLYYILSTVFFFSGASALMFEVIWFRLAGLFLGNSIWATSLVLAAFMAGLAIGNALAGSYSQKVRSPIRLYAFIEIFIAFSALSVIVVFSRLVGISLPVFSLFLDNPILLNLSRATIAFCVMLVPTVAMGATLPLLVKALYQKNPNFGRVLGTLYGWNTLGAMSGVLLSEMLIIETLGVVGTGFFAAGLNCLAAFIVMIIFAKGEGSENTDSSSPDPINILRIAAKRPVVASFFCGFILLALEVIWFRFLMLFYNGHSWNFAVMLAVILAGISLGGLFASRWFFRDREAHRFLFYLLLLNGLLVIILYGNFASMVFSSTAPFSVRSIEVAALYLMFPVSFISGIVFVMLGKKFHLYKIPESAAAGFLTMANTTGAMLGALVAGFVFIPFLGMEPSFLLLGLCYGIVAIVIEPVSCSFFLRKENVFKVGAFVVFLVAAIAFPWGHMRLFYIEAAADHYIKAYGEERVAFREGTGATIQYLRKSFLGQPHYYRMITNNYSMSGTGLSAKRYMKLFAYLPISLLKTPNKALLICFGTGSTAKALTDTDSLEHIDIVDTSKDVFELSSVIYSSLKENPIYDRRVRTYVEDGRFFLQTTTTSYDIITAEPPPPKFNGIVNLYSQEYFQLIYDRLAEGGITTYWLPVYQLKTQEAKAIVKGFCNVFEDCGLWTGAGLEWIMTGTKKHPGKIHEDNFSRQWLDPEIAEEMHSLGLVSPEQFGSLFIADGERLQKWLGDIPPLVDNYPFRLSPIAPKSQKHVQEYVKLMDPTESSKNFLTSENIKRLWPFSFRKQTESHFVRRQIINGLLDPMVSKYPRVIALDFCINTPGLRSYIPWAFHSDQDAQKILLSVQKTTDQQKIDMKGIYKHLAGMATQNGKYAEAARYMEASVHYAGKQTWENTLMRMYLLVLASKRDEALNVADEYLVNRENNEQIAKQFSYIWKWLDSLSVQ